MPDTSLWNEQKNEPVSEARGLAAATCTLFLGQGPMAPQTCLLTWGSQVCSADVTAAGYPVLTGGRYICDLYSVCCLESIRGLGGQGPLPSVSTHLGIVTEEFASPLHKHIRLGGSVLLQRSSQLAASIHTGLISFGLLQLPMPAALCPVPGSSGGHWLPLPSWGH